MYVRYLEGQQYGNSFDFYGLLIIIFGSMIYLTAQVEAGPEKVGADESRTSQPIHNAE